MNDLLKELEIRDVPDPDAQPDLKAEWFGKLIKATYPEKCLESIELPNREPILGKWLMQGDLGFVYGPRGLGKTWLGLYIARKIAEGGSAAHWNAHKPRRVLYVDGEMPFDEMCRRNAALTDVQTDGLFFQSNQRGLAQERGARICARSLNPISVHVSPL